MPNFLALLTNQKFLIGLGVTLAAYLLTLILVLVIWTARDARRRSKNWFFRYGSPLFVLAFNLLGFLIYIGLRPAKTIKQRKNERLERELLKQSAAEYQCPDCENIIGQDFAACPYCKTDFRAICECGAVLEKDWKRCGYCGLAVEKKSHKHNKYKEPILA